MNWDKKGGKFVASYHVKEKLLSVSQFFSPVFTVNLFFFFFTFQEISGTKEVTASHTEIMKRNRKL